MVSPILVTDPAQPFSIPMVKIRARIGGKVFVIASSDKSMRRTAALGKASFETPPPNDLAASRPGAEALPG